MIIVSKNRKSIKTQLFLIYKFQIMTLNHNLVYKKPLIRPIEWEFFIIIIFVILQKAKAQILEVFRNKNQTFFVSKMYTLGSFINHVDSWWGAK